jgi:hypothetical protein
MRKTSDALGSGADIVEADGVRGHVPVIRHGRRRCQPRFQPDFLRRLPQHPGKMTAVAKLLSPGYRQRTDGMVTWQ